MGRVPRYNEEQVRAAVAESSSLTAALRRLGLRPAGGNHQTLRKLIERYAISTEHFNQNWVLRGPRTRRAKPLSEVLVENSGYNRTKLKARLYDTGLRRRTCEICGQGEEWHGRHMSLILDHINGVATDNRIENLRIVCPNCAATLDTHCGRKKPTPSRTSILSALRHGVPRQLREPPLLLANLRHPQQRASIAETREAQGRAASLRAARGGSRVDEHPRDRP
jgi:hypothetical protein